MDRRTSGADRAAEADLARPLTDVLPDHTDETQGHHGEEKASHNPASDERCRAQAEIGAPEVGEWLHVVRPARREGLQPAGERLAEGGASARAQAQQDVPGRAVAGVSHPHTFEEEVPRAGQLAARAIVGDHPDDLPAVCGWKGVPVRLVERLADGRLGGAEDAHREVAIEDDGGRAVVLRREPAPGDDLEAHDASEVVGDLVE